MVVKMLRLLPFHAKMKTKPLSLVDMGKFRYRCEINKVKISRNKSLRILKNGNKVTLFKTKKQVQSLFK